MDVVLGLVGLFLALAGGVLLVLRSPFRGRDMVSSFGNVLHVAMSLLCLFVGLCLLFEAAGVRLF